MIPIGIAAYQFFTDGIAHLISQGPFPPPGLRFFAHRSFGNSMCSSNGADRKLPGAVFTLYRFPIRTCFTIRHKSPICQGFPPATLTPCSIDPNSPAPVFPGEHGLCTVAGGAVCEMLLEG